MKRKLNMIVLAFALLAVPLVWQGCAAGKGTYDPVHQTYDTNATASSLVVTVEKTRATALDVFAMIMQGEDKANELHVSTPEIHAFAEDIRKNGASYLDDLTRSKAAFQAARGTPMEGQASAQLTATLASIQSLIASATAHVVTLKLKK